MLIREILRDKRSKTTKQQASSPPGAKLTVVSSIPWKRVWNFVLYKAKRLASIYVEVDKRFSS